ncbi:MAG: beta-aspartyl-peptidase, partial [Gammaproteobacteria bacterium]
MSMLFIKNAQTYTPESIGRKDVLLAGNKVLAIEDSISEHHLLPGTKVIDASHHLLVPGFVDSLVHITGGGGEGGFHTRTPAMDLSDATTAGITTLVGALGTDSTTRSLPDLLAKARALSHEGITCYCHTGSYQVPVTTITGS